MWNLAFVILHFNWKQFVLNVFINKLINIKYNNYYDLSKQCSETTEIKKIRVMYIFLIMKSKITLYVH